MEGYILATAKIASQPGEHHKVVLANGGGPNSKVEWHRVIDHYTCMVTKPKKESKLKGLRSFIAYSLTSSMSGIQVSRRYKHFDWLHLQLSNKYLLIPIPPLPEKQVAGLFFSLTLNFNYYFNK
jgi:sorting nexin-9/18/33